jgi:hydrogenase nickel incorporation protein HypB
MCETCGCSDDSKPKLVNLQSGQTLAIGTANDRDVEHEHAGSAQHDRHRHHHHDHDHHYDHDHDHDRDHDEAHNGHTHSHAHAHSHSEAATVRLETNVLAKNNRLAERNRGWFAGRNILALNLMSAPGAGKTTLLERTINDLRTELALSVIEGDQETINDAERIRATGCSVVQINTGTGCHLDAVMLAKGLQELAPPMNSIVMIENVGNLVCPAGFDLGEAYRVVMLSVTEGEDKPLKYPDIFHTADLVLVAKCDLLPHVDFDVPHAFENVRRVNPRVQALCISARTGQGMDEWAAWLEAGARIAATRADSSAGIAAPLAQSE